MATLTDAEIDERLSGTAGWRRVAGDPPSIERDFEFADFAAALEFVDRVGAAAEAANHHPDILLHGWNKVRLTLSTHSQGGLTGADFELAGQLDRLV
jgi:4a-hydroxytetrahydrobiopterin dehydratase